MDFITHDLQFNGTLRPRTSTDFIIFHHAEASKCTVEDIHQWHKQRGWIGIGYNMVVYKDGSVHIGRPLDCADADAYGYNNNSLSVCFVGNFEVEKMTEAQVQTGIELVKYFRKQYPKLIPISHMDVNDTACPGRNFDNRIVIDGMKDVVPEVDKIFKNCVDLVAKEIGLNNPDFWYKAQYQPEVFMKGLKSEYVVRLMELMANRLYMLTDV
jgi:hypothetical protein